MNLRRWMTNGKGRGPQERLALPLELEDGRPVRAHRALLWGAIAAVAALSAWASLTPIRELAIAPGQIMPEGDIAAVQHLEGGIVARLAATAGDRVSAGQPLVELADEQAVRDLAQAQVRAGALGLQREQIAALLDDRDLALRSSIIADPLLVAAQEGVFAARLRARIDENKALQARVAQREAEIAGAEAELEGLRRVVGIQEERVRSRQDLLAKGLTTRREFLADKAQLEQAIAQRDGAEGRVASLRQQASEAEALLQGAEAEARRLWSEEMARIGAELAETEQTVARLKDRVDRLIVRAPVAGIVQFIAPRATGEVVRPGDVIARVVPIDAPLLAEVQVRADDIGHIKVGDPAEVRVSTFDASVYGKLDGTVRSVSASTFQRENGEYFFKATIALESQLLAGRAPISPGMVVTAEIVTGAKSFARYLLKPVFKTFGPAFSEK